MKASELRFPKECGAWWTFEVCLAAGLWEAWSRTGALAAALSLAAGMHVFFLTGEWMVALGFGGVLPDGRPWMERGFAALGSVLLGAGIAWAPAPARPALLGGLAFWAALAAGVLRLRLGLPSRDLRLLMALALLLTGPALILGLLAFGGAVAVALAFWCPWAWFFPFSLLYIQTWLRGNTLPRWRIAAASLPFVLEALALGLDSGPWGALVLLLLSARIVWRLGKRLREYGRYGAVPRLAGTPWEVRLLGYEQMAWSLVLTFLWTRT